jgi:hypothetical protein
MSILLRQAHIGNVDQITWSATVVSVAEIVVDKDAGKPGPAKLLIITQRDSAERAGPAIVITP